MYVCVYVDSGEGGQGSWRARWMNGRKGGVLLTSIACVVRSFVGLAAGLGGGGGGVWENSYKTEGLSWRHFFGPTPTGGIRDQIHDQI